MKDEFGLGWRLFFTALLVVYMLLAIGIWKLHIPKPVERMPEEHVATGGKMSVLTKGRIACLAFGIMISAGTEIGIAFFIGTHAKETLGTEAYNSIILSAFWLTQIFSRCLIGMIKRNTRLVLSLQMYIHTLARKKLLKVHKKNQIKPK